MVAKRRPYDTRGLGESLKMLKLYREVGFFHSFLNVILIVVTFGAGEEIRSDVMG